MLGGSSALEVHKAKGQDGGSVVKSKRPNSVALLVPKRHVSYNSTRITTISLL
jgi:hypothetical protein